MGGIQNTRFERRAFAESGASSVEEFGDGGTNRDRSERDRLLVHEDSGGRMGTIV